MIKIHTLRLPSPFFSFVLLVILLTPELARTQIPPSTLEFPEGVHRVEIPFTRYRDWIIVHAKVPNSGPLSFILDTGAPIAILADPEAGNTFQLPIVGQAMVDGGEGETSQAAPLAAGVTIELGSLKIGNCLIAIGAATDAIYGVDGILGKYVFENAVVEINWEKQVLILSKPEHFRYEGRGARVPFRMASNGHIFTDITIQSESRATSIPALLDTGNRSNLKLDQPGYTDYYLNGDILEEVITGWGANGPEHGNLGRMNVEFGGFPIQGLVTSTRLQPHPTEDAEPKGNIGLSVLQRFNLIFNYRDSVLILEKNRFFDRPDSFTRSGIQIRPNLSAGPVIAGILPDSPAAEAGLRTGDVITHLNEKPVASYSPTTLDKLLRGTEAETLLLTIRREDTSFEKRLLLRDLL